MCLGSPTPANGFIDIDIDMKTIVHDSGIGQRRCEYSFPALEIIAHAPELFA